VQFTYQPIKQQLIVYGIGVNGIDGKLPTGKIQTYVCKKMLAERLKLIFLIVPILFFQLVRGKDIFENEGYDN